MPKRTEPLIVIPCRHGSAGIPAKNFRPMAGRPLWLWTQDVAEALQWPYVVTTDAEGHRHIPSAHRRPDDMPDRMYDIVLDAIAGRPGDPIVLLQPTVPLRQATEVYRAVKLLRQTNADSVVSVSPLPITHSPDLVMRILGGELVPYSGKLATRRQEATPVYLRDGTVYAVWRRTILDQGSLYGRTCHPLIIPAKQAFNLDTPDDWDACELHLARNML